MLPEIMSEKIPKDAAHHNQTQVVICWHMHQPPYFDTAEGAYQLPWTYLHAIKDYVDMAAIIEAIPEARAVVNFSPTLLEQIDDYAKRTRAWLETDHALPDPLLAWLASDTLPVDMVQRKAIISQGLRANKEHLIARFRPYEKLAQLAEQAKNNLDILRYLSEQFFFDLLVWHHLAWLGETIKIENHFVQNLIEKESGYNLEDRRGLIKIIAEQLESIIPRYRKLAASGKIELSVSPYSHPIMPLLLDINSGREAVPDMKVPSIPYPGGEDRVRDQLKQSREVFRRYFGFEPIGCWPSEGAICAQTLKIIGETGFKWAASGETVLRNSLNPNSGNDSHCLHQPYQLDGTSPTCFFRDDQLSDLIGFQYASWHADDAVANLTHHIENIGKACCGAGKTVVSIILDGENCWEHYPNNGNYFLNALYRSLGTHPDLKLTTFADCLQAPHKNLPLNQLITGSWVYGTLSTWVGDADKNRAWELLCEAKLAYDQALESGSLDALQQQAASCQLAICEASDWFWWFGDYNPADAVMDFDQLYRTHLSYLYALIGCTPPPILAHSLFTGSGEPELGGVMRRGED